MRVFFMALSAVLALPVLPASLGLAKPSPAKEDAKQQKPAGPLDHTFGLTSEGFKVKVLVNDVPVMEASKGERTSQLVKVNPWLLSGENVVRVELDHLPVDNRYYKFFYRVDPLGSRSGDKNILDDLLNLKDLPKTSSFTKEYRISVPKAPPSDFFAKAKPLELDRATKKAVMGLLLELHAAYQARNAARLTELMSYRGSEVFMAMGGAPASAAATISAAMEDLKKYKTWQVVPIDPNQIKARLVARKQIIMVERKDGAWLLDIKTEKADEKNGMDRLFVAVVDGKWKIVR